MLTIYKASAGSGKTFQLARKYIQLLLGYQPIGSKEWRLYEDFSDAHRGILAITFTNKATAEMKRRIIEELSLLADDENREKSFHLDYFREIFGTGSEQIGHRAKIALEALLVNFYDFNVSTIDSFFQNVLRTFAHELELPDNFDIKLDDNEIVAIAVEDLLVSLNGESPLLERLLTKEEISHIMEWLKKYMKSMLREGQRFNLFRREGSVRKSLVEYITKMLNERFKENSDAIIEWCNNSQTIDELEEHLRCRIKEAEEMAVKIGPAIDALPDKLVKKSDLIKIAKKCLNVGNPAKTIQRLFDEDFDSFFKADFFKKPNAEIGNRVVSICTTILSLLNDVDLCRLLIKEIYPIGLLAEVIKRMEAYRVKNSSFLLSDTNNFLNKIIDEEDTPFIYERLGSRLKHFLLDEFQDTSRLQWVNLRPLLLESLATGQENLIIGDEKQCIYRFRNSDPNLINSKVREEIRKRSHDLDEQGTSLNANTNRRSLPNIIKFNNSLFVELSDMVDLSDFYSNTVQKVADNRADGQQGLVDVLFTGDCITEGSEEDNDGKKKKEVKGYVFEFALIKDHTDYSLSEKIGLDRMASGIIRQLKQGFRPADIAILVRRNSEGEKAIRALIELFASLDFKEYGIDRRPEIVSGEALTLGESPAVNFIISRLRVNVLPKIADFSQSKKNDVYKKYLKQADDRLRLNRFLNLFHYYSDAPTVSDSDYPTAMNKALRDLNLMTEQDKNIAESYLPDSILSQAERIFGEYVSGLEDDDILFVARNENVYVSTLFDKIVEFQSRKGNNILDFMRWWDEKGKETNVKLSENDNAIRVLTIHKSKGLEFDCIHLPLYKGTLYDKPRFGQRNYYWFDMKDVGNHNMDYARLLPPFMPLPIGDEVENIKGLRHQYLMQRRGESLDCLNVLYVALTRARKELIVTVGGKTEPSKTGGENPDISLLMHQAIEGCTNPVDKIGKDTEKDIKKEYLPSLAAYFDKGHFLMGVPVGKEIVPKDNGGEQKGSETIMMPPLIHRDVRPITAVTKPLSEGAVDFRDKTRVGILFHAILSRINTWDDLDYAVRYYAYKKRLTDKETNYVRSTLRDAYQKLEHKEWFNGFKDILNEVPIYNFVSEEENKRPDRVILQPDGSVDIVDYKFATPKADEHHRQVMRYTYYFRQLGYKNVKGWLWYPLRAMVVEVR